MSILQNVNQLLTAAAYFAEPHVEQMRAKQAQSQLRKGTDIGAAYIEKTGQNVPATVERDITQAWYGLGKREFSRKPTMTNFENYVKAARDAEAAAARWQSEALGQNQTRQNVSSLRERIMEGETPTAIDESQRSYNIPTDPAEILTPRSTKKGGENA